MSDDKALNLAKTHLTDYMASHNMRRTPERFIILEKALGMPELFAAEALLAKVKEEVHVSRASVYNALQLFINAGLLRKHELKDRTFQYEKVTLGRTQMTHHLVCSQCGKVKKMKDTDLASEINSRHYPTFKVTHYTLTLYGVCSKCAKKTKRK